MPQILKIAACLAAVAALGPRAGAEVSRAPKIGLWYTVWWTVEDEHRHWVNCQRMPTRGRYSAGDPKVIAADYALFRDLGIDFLIMDDTNGVGADAGRINDNIRAWFEFMDARPAAERIPICIGGGGEMRAEGATGQKRADDFYLENWTKRPSYFQFDGKPLLLVDTDDNLGPGDFDDDRFALRWAYNGDNFEAMKKRKTWGWGSYEPVPVLEESMSIWPGHRFPKSVAEQGQDPLEEPREGGNLYVRKWLSVLKNRPRTVTIADWNNFEEETAIESSPSWEDPRGYSVPDLYIRITRAYSRLRSEKLVKGECYRDEAKPEVYFYDGKSLTHIGETPRRGTVILVPKGMLARIKATALDGAE